MADWADDKAREWLNAVPWVGAPERHKDSLAALLRDVGGHYVTHMHFDDHDKIRAAVLVEVRRVVEEESRSSSYRLVDRIFARLEKL